MNQDPTPDAPSIGIVIPIHNEAGFLPEAIDLLSAELRSVPAPIHAYLIENGSSDGTARIAAELAATRDWLTVESLPDPDYGLAMRHGFKRAVADGADWVVNFDIDYFSGQFVADLVSSGSRADLVIASKRAPGSSDRRSVLRRTATLVFNLILRVALRSGVSDTHGIKGFRRELVEKLVDSVQSNADLFDTELVLRAERAGYEIHEVPVVVEELRTTRSSLLRRVPRTLRGIMRVRRSLARESA